VKARYDVGCLAFVKDKAEVDWAFVWADLEENDKVVAELGPSEPVIILSPIQVDPMTITDGDTPRTPTLYKVLSRGGVGWISTFNLLPCSSGDMAVSSSK
jgi:hypothetical protein